MKMITQIKSRLFLLLLVLTCAGSALADTTFKITDGVVESQLKDRMEANTKALLDAFRKAADDGEKTVKLSKDNISKAAIEEIREIWKSSADTTPIQRQISCNIQNDNKTCVNANIYSI